MYAMSPLDYLLIALAIIIPGGIPLYLYWKYRTKKFNEAEAQLQESIDSFTNALVEAAQEGVNEELDNVIKEAPDGIKYKTVETSYLSNPRYLVTLLTTIIKKYGIVNLSEEDFANVSKKDYISLYIDMKTNNIILKPHSTDSDSAEALNEITPYIAGPSDEDIFH